MSGNLFPTPTRGMMPAITVRSSVALAMSRQPISQAALPAFRCKAVGNFALRHPIARRRLEMRIGFLGRGRIAAIRRPLIGRPAMIELMDHLGFVERHIALDGAVARRLQREARSS